MWHSSAISAETEHFGGKAVNRNSVFLTAFWTGLAAPTSLYAGTPPYRPLVADLTFHDSFAFVGYYLNQALSESGYDGSAAAAPVEGGTQLSFEFAES
jgi:hypothetical protein